MRRDGSSYRQYGGEAHRDVKRPLHPAAFLVVRLLAGKERHYERHRREEEHHHPSVRASIPLQLFPQQVERLRQIARADRCENEERRDRAYQNSRSLGVRLRAAIERYDDRREQRKRPQRQKQRRIGRAKPPHDAECERRKLGRVTGRIHPRHSEKKRQKRPCHGEQPRFEMGRGRTHRRRQHEDRRRDDTSESAGRQGESLHILTFYAVAHEERHQQAERCRRNDSAHRRDKVARTKQFGEDGHKRIRRHSGRIAPFPQNLQTRAFAGIGV